MNFLVTLALTLLISTSSFAFSHSDKENEKAMKWSFDKTHSAVGFNVRHILTPVNGQFKAYDGEVYFDPKNLENSSINVSVDVSSVNTDNSKRDGHLQSPDFFDAANFPKMTFVSSEIINKGDRNYVAKGKLTIKNVTKEIELPFKLLGTMAHPFMKGSTIAAFEASYTINRNEFTVGSGDWVQTAIVGDEVEIKITLEMFTAK